MWNEHFCSSRVAPVLGYALVIEETPRAHQGHAYRSSRDIRPGRLPFTLRVSKRRGQRVVQIGGELDIVTRNIARRACLDGRGKDVVVEMADMTFMDCCGYGGLVAAREALQAMAAR